MIRKYSGIYVTCDEPGCRVQTGSTCTDHGEKGPPFAHWDSWSVEGKQFCPRHHKDRPAPEPGEQPCGHRNSHFDRTLCAEPCGAMHNYCNDCGRCLDACAHDGGTDDAR